jgi:hypothetical protein
MTPKVSTLRAMVRALTVAGIEFLQANEAGEDVRLPTAGIKPRNLTLRL